MDRLLSNFTMDLVANSQLKFRLEDYQFLVQRKRIFCHPDTDTRQESFHFVRSTQPRFIWQTIYVSLGFARITLVTKITLLAFGTDYFRV